MNDIVVKHTESFDINIEEIKPNLGPLKSLAQSIINGVLKPTDDTVTFSGGKGVIGEGETVPLLLPKRQGFDLPAAGAATATARQARRWGSAVPSAAPPNSRSNGRSTGKENAKNRSEAFRFGPVLFYSVASSSKKQIYGRIFSRMPSPIPLTRLRSSGVV